MTKHLIHLPLTLLLTACSAANPPSHDVVVTEDVGDSSTMIVSTVEMDGASMLSLEGAVVAVAQDGEIVTQETNAEGLARFAIDPNGGPLDVTAYHPGYPARTYAGYDRESLRATFEPMGQFVALLGSKQKPLTAVRGRITRTRADAVLNVLSSDGSRVQDQRDEFMLSVARDSPFTLTAYEFVVLDGPSPSEGLHAPISFWRTLRHPGGSAEVDESLLVWEHHALRSFRMLVKRPKPDHPLGGDDVAIIGHASAVDGQEFTPAADISRIAPWSGSRAYDLTLTGPSDILEHEGVRTEVMLAKLGTTNPVAPYSGIAADGTPDRLVDPFLELPIPTGIASFDQPLVWTSEIDENLWTFLFVSDSEALRWTVTAPPGVSSLDMPSLVATLPIEALGTGTLRGELRWCDTDGAEDGECARRAGGVEFAWSGATRQ